MAPPASALTLEQLPDDILVMAMQFVSMKDVLACRLVCQRLSGLALHRDVWRHRSLRDDHPNAGAVLHLAPCLDKLRVTGRVPTLAAATTRCAVACLELYSYMEEAFNASEYALAVRNQESLGRLRRLVLRIGRISLEKTKADVLIRTAATCSGLDSLDVDVPLQTTHPDVHGPPSASLTCFIGTIGGNSKSFVDTILAGHAATLEEVEIYTLRNLAKITMTGELLAALPRLRVLRCNGSISGLESVAECKTLREVDISISQGVDLDRVAKLLRRAKQLRHVIVTNLVGDFSKLVEALISPGPSGLQTLGLEGLFTVERPLLCQDVRPLFRALPSLPALRHLDVDAEPDEEMLQGITPVTAPALRRLEVVVGVRRCPHAWVHGAAIKATLTANPLLHIQIWCRTGLRSDHQECEMCELECHPDVKWHEVRKLGLYFHDPDTCPSPEDHTNDTERVREANVACTWIHL